ncbi:MAG TPA: tail fiber domain-containing protein, partial [Thermoanaerobaculia bacterium]|nr:tail fiber domain-containing protein [Thermoanaerobaculia bacterium]
AFRFGAGGTRNHLISNRDMVFNAHSAAVTGSPLFYWRRNPNRFDESSFADLMRLTDAGSLIVFGGVGINTTSPGYPLEVSSAGDTQVGLRSDTTGGRVWTLQSSNGQAGGTSAGSFQIVDRTSGQSRLAITSAGQVAINATDPLGFTFSVNGSASKPGGGSWSLYSDARLKRDIRPLQGTLDRLLALRGVTFEYVDPEAIHELPGTRIGMVAQEVETVFPDWVSEGPDGYRRLTMRGFEALAVEALRDLRREKDDEISALKSALETQRAEIAALRAAIDRLSADRAERSDRWQR